MTGFIARVLTGRGLTPVLAHYEPYSVSPHLSVPSFRLWRNRVGVELRRGLEDYETHAIGAWLPELEFTHYQATAHWRRVMDSCEAHVTVAGNVLAAMPYQQTGRPFLAWVATGWEEDRKDRVAARFPWPRKLLDRMVNGPVLRRQERRVLGAGSILALSEYTRRTLDMIAGAPLTIGVLPMPVDADHFQPRPTAVMPRRIGFFGRLEDPRKNLELLLAALARANHAGAALTALLIGTPDQRIGAMVRALGLDGRVEFLPYLPRSELRDWLQTLDVFALPSHQEGLCIAALEAMACGCPVVSTRCGGPEEFVIDGETGFLVGFDAAEMADALTRVVANRALRERLAEGARRRLETHYTRAKAEAVFWNTFDRTFPNLAK
jgi:glycosyltransferase involved in cell wall biosynthesis